LAHPSADRQEPLIAVDQDRTVVRPYRVNKKNPFLRPVTLAPSLFSPPVSRSQAAAEERSCRRDRRRR
jgi:hypothetical protein